MELKHAIEAYLSSLILLNKHITVNPQGLGYLTRRIVGAFNEELYRAEVAVSLSTDEYRSVIVTLESD